MRHLCKGVFAAALPVLVGLLACPTYAAQSGQPGAWDVRDRLAQRVQYSRATGDRIVTDDRYESWTTKDRATAQGRIEAVVYRSGGAAFHELIATGRTGGIAMDVFVYAYSVLLQEDGTLISATEAETIALQALASEPVSRPYRAEKRLSPSDAANARYMASAIVLCARKPVLTLEFRGIENNECQAKLQSVQQAYRGIVRSKRIQGTTEQLVAAGWNVLGIGASGRDYNIRAFNPPLCNPPFTAPVRVPPPPEMASRYIKNYIEPRAKEALLALPANERPAAAVGMDAFLAQLRSVIVNYETVVVTPPKIEDFLKGDGARARESLPYFTRCIERLREGGMTDETQIAARAFLAMRDQQDGGRSQSEYTRRWDNDMRRWVYALEFPMTEEQRSRLNSDQRGNRSYTLLDFLTSTGAPLGLRPVWYGVAREEIIAGTDARRATLPPATRPTP